MNIPGFESFLDREAKRSNHFERETDRDRERDRESVLDRKKNWHSIYSQTQRENTWNKIKLITQNKTEIFLTCRLLYTYICYLLMSGNIFKSNSLTL